ncbi:hypothetical protein [Microcoleus sp. Pol11C3]|uniref:hypothetical protein n=1 Tax=Microcoleus sp. Pol11C3 TaxID=3055390 RepID=UPI002FD44FEF
MTHFGLICPASTGHLNTMLPLGKELQRRGHRVTLFGILDAQANTLATGLEFQAIGESEYPAGKMVQLLTQLGKLSGMTAYRPVKTIRRGLTSGVSLVSLVKNGEHFFTTSTVQLTSSLFELD